jgi:DnaK suppressor protein
MKRGRKQKAKKARSQRRPESRNPARKSRGTYSRFLNILNKKREDILKVVKKTDASVTVSAIGDEADVASQTFERELMFEMNDSERVILDDIEAALRKMEKGEFGICESCHKKISGERLRAMPWARYCIQCQARTEAPSNP